ncbi:RdgB/HAM1 family non-canonical purine NTP pyrophosphatase [Leifsonia sp. Leaf264]|uniref:RdgB/HAM1 family non-canonical purine NTP pyrophosphatase n=1 Tax=Leifsonia sp. Leaf264 TaxID=1736314 RepID=UPI0007000BAE|nr:RdgB/HAM1 family non-canonical purine NTP pyrophosphatase [Leifsonia sp. Leaf264]KQP01516.1 non-canonical purine NTP pyrophosphatase [Leifsonia sp. Leaf264]
MSLEVVLATHNQHKVEEFQRILGAAMPSITVVAYDGPEPVEDGLTFAENALIKARAAAAHTGLVALADDSGICVDVLGGAPGIFSARWAGGRDSADNLALLLAQVSDIADPHRGAHFTCAIAIVAPDAAGRPGFEEVASGEWPGRLASAASGAHGFGYDPIFVPDGHDMSAAELAPEVKNAESHRARAFTAAIPVLQRLV